MGVCHSLGLGSPICVLTLLLPFVQTKLDNIWGHGLRFYDRVPGMSGVWCCLSLARMSGVWCCLSLANFATEKVDVINKDSILFLLCQLYKICFFHYYIKTSQQPCEWPGMRISPHFRWWQPSKIKWLLQGDSHFGNQSQGLNIFKCICLSLSSSRACL